MLGDGEMSVKRNSPLCCEDAPGYYRASSYIALSGGGHSVEAGVVLTWRSLLDKLERLRSQHRRRLTFLSPALERRRPRIAAENYAARHSIEHTLDRKAELRRLAPSWPQAAKRYHQLLTYELEGLREVVAALHVVTEGRERDECLAEAAVQIERLEIEVAWCASLLQATRGHSSSAAVT